MERKKRCIRSLSKKDTKEEDDTGVHIDDLPEEMFLKILGYLKYDELSRAGRVCKKWYTLTRCSLLWKRVDVCFALESIPMPEKAIKFVGVLPEYVTHLKLNFKRSSDRITCVRRITFAEFSMKVQEKCPNLQVLVFHGAVLSNYEPSFDYDGLLSNVRALVFYRCFIQNAASYMNPKVIAEAEEPYIDHELAAYKYISKLQSLENLCLAGSSGFHSIFFYYPSILSRLKVLNLQCTPFCFKSSFPDLWHYGHQLVELYICYTVLSDYELDFTKSLSTRIPVESLLDSDDEQNFSESSSDSAVSDDELVFTKSSSVLPCLKTVCLRHTKVTCIGVSSLLKSCENLQCIYVGDGYDYANCNSKKVHILHGGYKHCNHYANMRYMHL